MSAPVQVIVVGVGVEAPSWSGDVLACLAELGEAGVVRLVDLLVVSRDSEGTLHTSRPPPGLPSGMGRLAAAVLGHPADADPVEADDQSPDESLAVAAWSLADAVPLGSTAVVALIEHLWAAPLRDAVHRAGGTALDETWLAPEDLELLASLRAGRPTE